MWTIYTYLIPTVWVGYVALLRRCIVYKLAQSYDNNRKISFTKGLFFSAKLEKLDLLVSRNWLMGTF